MIRKPQYNDLPPYCHHYVDLVGEPDLIDALKRSSDTTTQLMSSLEPGREHFRYAENKWTLREVFGHIIDCERVFAYRALRFSRLDDTELAGFDENEYVVHGPQRALHELLDEYNHVRCSTLHLFEHMTDRMLDFKGKANNALFTPRGLGFMTAGHNIHHCNIIKERYL